MLKCAIIGLGKIAQTSHVPAYLSRRVKKKISVVGGVDISEENSKDFKKLIPGAEIFSNTDDLFKNLDIDFVDICVPPSLHAKYLNAALKYNVGIICEKPFTKELKEAALLKRKLLEKKPVFIPCHQYKYSPVWKNFKSFSDKTTGGNFLQFNIFRNTADLGYDKNNPGWRTDKKLSGGGILSDTGTHYLYLSSWILDKPIQVSVFNDTLKHNKYSVEDTSVVILKCEKGIAEINLTWAADRRANNAFISDGKRSMSYDGKKICFYDKDKAKEIHVPDASDKRTYLAFYEDLFLDFANAMKAKKFDRSLIEESYESVKLLDLCYKSAEKKKTLIVS
ncbi:MAG: Gfo/Idh/MocA family oxidoreductase [Ignavibacteriae bacterium]|nr:Gfo/Idh/MocA family oxidoreductase [Ignavibacteriota bacterium]